MIEEYPDTIIYPGYEDALVGITHMINGGPTVAIYSAMKIVEILVGRDGMTPEEAVEYLEYNIIGMYLGAGTPIIMIDNDI